MICCINISRFTVCVCMHAYTYTLLYVCMYMYTISVYYICIIVCMCMLSFRKVSLRKCECDINLLDVDCVSMLHYVVRKMKPDYVQLLVDCGAGECVCMCM